MSEIVVGFDTSKSSMEAVRWAADEAERSGDRVRVLQSRHEPLFVERSWIDRWEDPDADEREARARLYEFVDEVSEEHPEVDFSSALVGDPPAELLVEAGREASMIVVGARGRGGFSRLLLGSVSERVASRATCSVAVVRPGGAPGGAVVVGVDGSEASRGALRWAADAAHRRGVPLRVVLAWSYLLPAGEWGPVKYREDYEPADADRALRAIVDDVLGPAPAGPIELAARCELPEKALLERADEAELLVLGPRRSHQRVDFDSVALRMLRHASGTVVIARPSAG